MLTSRRMCVYTLILPRLAADLCVADELKLPPGEASSGFPDHPHRGFETCSIMLSGKMEHRDHVGNHGVIGPGGVQWMCPPPPFSLFQPHMRSRLRAHVPQIRRRLAHVIKRLQRNAFRNATHVEEFQAPILPEADL